VGSGECTDEPLGPGTMELVSYELSLTEQCLCSVTRNWIDNLSTGKNRHSGACSDLPILCVLPYTDILHSRNRLSCCPSTYCHN
jgi:hypothetical protein